MSEQNPFRAETAQILLANQRTRYAKVFSGMTRGLSDVEMSQEADADGIPCRPDSIAAVRKTVQLTLDDVLVAAPSDAEGQAGLYREFLNYSPSQNLRQHIFTRLTQLQTMDPTVKMTPLGHVNLGSNTAAKPEAPEQVCPDCFLVHAGECP